uniref:Large ribosomal subunit protein mL45 n=1 Tax=Dermatophagoides pteronyssinus TaxID=6956 RepID=A0A6P6XZH5_DERPT|nr:probable 39S ribosomal protein L45, mitochondrial [Dermatophagoides pteronyssinus]
MFLLKNSIINKFYPVISRSIHLTTINRARDIKPWNVGLEGEWRKARSKKVLKFDLPDFEQIRSDTKLTPEEYVSKLKEKGIAPPKQYKEKPIVVTTTQGVLDPYVPPEGDGKYSILSKTGVGQKAQHIKQKTASFMALRKIKSYEDNFDLPTFVDEAKDIYIKAHELLVNWNNPDNKEKLLDYVTEFAYPLMTFQRDLKTIRWSFIKLNDIPDVIQIRTQSLIEKTNMFSQITVRMNSRQILAIYDRFGHLMYGSDVIVKDVLEYLVFEKNISDFNGRWRLHAKILPDWMPPKDPIRKTFIRDPLPEPPSAEELRFEREGIISDENKEEKDQEKQQKIDKIDSTPITAA